VTDQNPETPREPSGAVNHDQENVAPQSGQDRVVGGDDADGAARGGTPANQGPAPA